MDLRAFELNGRPGRLAIDYGVNNDLAESGFDIFNPADFAPSWALGYPTLRVWVERYEGSGHRTASAFVQWLDVEREDASGARAYRELDVIESFAGAGIPFFAMGYPANLYDAPAHKPDSTSGSNTGCR